MWPAGEELPGCAGFPAILLAPPRADGSDDSLSCGDKPEEGFAEGVKPDCGGTAVG